VEDPFSVKTTSKPPAAAGRSNVEDAAASANYILIK
jgi:hypothetical protein